MHGTTNIKSVNIGFSWGSAKTRVRSCYTEGWKRKQVFILSLTRTDPELWILVTQKSNDIPYYWGDSTVQTKHQDLVFQDPSQCNSSMFFKNGFLTYMLYSSRVSFNPYPSAFPYGNGMVLHFYQQKESSTTKTVHKVINKGLKTYV